MTTDKQLEALRKALRHKVKDASGDVTVAAAELRTVLDELGRLQQSNDRLRRQNRRVRLKLQRAGLLDDTANDAGEAGAADAVDDEAP
jgi:chromosome segregation ATPase